MKDDALRKPRVAAVVLNWRDTIQTVTCVRSILATSDVDRIYVVDNEADGSLKLALNSLAGTTIELIESIENRGFSAGVNLGLSLALAKSFDQILVVNNDAYIQPDVVKKLSLGLTNNPGALIAGPTIVNSDLSPQSSGGRLNSFTFAIDSRPGRTPIDFLTWACVLLPRTTLETIGFLDERFFMYWEDVDYGFRIQDAGGQMLSVSSAMVVHNISSSHKKAGDWILAYSSLGLSAFGHKRGGLLLIASSLRMVLRLGRLVLRGRWAAAGLSARFWALGRFDPGTPAFMAVHDAKVRQYASK